MLFFLLLMLVSLSLCATEGSMDIQKCKVSPKTAVDELESILRGLEDVCCSECGDCSVGDCCGDDYYYCYSCNYGYHCCGGTYDGCCEGSATGDADFWIIFGSVGGGIGGFVFLVIVVAVCIALVAKGSSDANKNKV